MLTPQDSSRVETTRIKNPNPTTYVSAFLIAATIGFCLAVTLVFLNHPSATLTLNAKSGPAYKTSSLKPITGVPAVDSDTVAFNALISSMDEVNECFPIHLRRTQDVGIDYLFCSDKALDADSESQKLTETFTVPSTLARRFNFWKRIYSLWTKDQYVLHVSVWPEVVLEAYDASFMGGKRSAVVKEIRVKKVAKTQRRHYKRLLQKMHQYKNSPERFTPAMKRIARTMAHITDKNKYSIASQSLRTQRGQRDFIASGLATAPKYLPEIKKNFESQGIPAEIALLAFVESSFNLKARSKVGASGVYQIMPATGKQYLKLHTGVDERNDPIKASLAAAKLLKLNYKLLGEWPLAVTAYNHGVGSMRRGVKQTGSTDMSILIKKYKNRSFGFASKNFFCSYLGVLATMKDVDIHFQDVKVPDQLAFRTTKLRASTSIRTISKKFGVSTSQIQTLNPDILPKTIRSRGALPKGFVLKLPSTKASPAALASSESSAKDAKSPIVFTTLIPES